MDVTLLKKTEELAKELAQNSSTLEDLNQVMWSLMKTTIERMLNTEMAMHPGRRAPSSSSIQCRPLEERLVVHPPLLHATVTAIRPASQRPPERSAGSCNSAAGAIPHAARAMAAP